MDYMKLLAGGLLIAVFGWLLWRNSKRHGFANAILSIDIILGLIAGFYLLISSLT